MKLVFVGVAEWVIRTFRALLRTFCDPPKPHPFYFIYALLFMLLKSSFLFANPNIKGKQRATT